VTYRRINYSPTALAKRKAYQRNYARVYRRTPSGRAYSKKAWALYSAKVGDDVKKEQQKRATFNWRLRQLGVTHSVIEKLIKAGCMICGKRRLRSKERRILCLDHDHKTGRFRGILCNGCNTALGQFGDNPRIVQKALDYLRGKV
jgi:hypothetical protein